MTFTLVPNSGQSLGQTRIPINTNFSVIQTAQDVNHVALNSVGAGKHKFLQMPNQGTPPTTAANESGIFAYLDPVNADSEVYFRRENKTGAFAAITKDLPITSIPITAAGVFNSTGSLLGRSFNMAAATRNSLGVFTINFTQALPTTNYIILCTPQYTGSGVTDNIVTCRINTKAVGSAQIVFTLRSGGSNQLFDPTSFSVMVWSGLS